MTEILQVYAQTGPHDSSFICGTEKELINLRDTLNVLLMQDHSTISYDTFTSDGEGYTLRIIKMTEDEFDKLQLPYTSEIFSEEHFKFKKHPWFYDTYMNFTTRNSPS